MRKPLVVLAPFALLLAACSPQSGEAISPEQSQTTTESTGAAEHEGHDHADDEQTHEAAVPRLVLSYDGGVMVLDADTMELVADIPVPGTTGVIPAADGLHAVIQTAQGDKVLFVGTWAAAHGDHLHYFSADPEVEEDAQVESGTVANENDGSRFQFDGKTVTAVDIETGEEWLTGTVPHDITGLAVFSGEAVQGDFEGGEGEHEHDHEDHDHDHEDHEH